MKPSSLPWPVQMHAAMRQLQTDPEAAVLALSSLRRRALRLGSADFADLAQDKLAWALKEAKAWKRCARTCRLILKRRDEAWVYMILAECELAQGRVEAAANAVEAVFERPLNDRQVPWANRLREQIKRCRENG